MKKQLYNALRNTLYLGVCAFLLCACQGKDGAPGPIGNPGAAGATGAIGSKGKDANYYNKTGRISGKITGFRRDGITPVSQDFKYEYNYNTVYESAIATEITPTGTYLFNFQLSDSSNRNNNFSLQFEAPLDLSTIAVKRASVSYSKDLDANQVLIVAANYFVYGGKPASPITFTDLKYNTVTGMLTGTYTWNAIMGDDYNYDTGDFSTSSTASGHPMTISGEISVVFRQVSSFRIGADQ